jgi:flagellar FliL protein
VAEQNEDDEAANGTDKDGTKVGKKRLILLIGGGLLIIGLSVGGTLAVVTMIGPELAAVESESSSEETEAVEEPIKQATYFPIKPPIIVTFDARGRQRYLQAEVTLLIRDTSLIAVIELHMPMIRNALNFIIGGQLYEEVQTAEGKELMRLQCLQELQKLIEQETGQPGIEQVLFTNMVMQ